MSADENNQVRIRLTRNERASAERLDNGYFRLTGLPVSAGFHLGDIVLADEDLQVVEVLQSNEPIKVKFKYFGLDQYCALCDEAEKEDISIASLEPGIGVASLSKWQQEIFVNLLHKHYFTVRK